MLAQCVGMYGLCGTHSLGLVQPTHRLQGAWGHTLQILLSVVERLGKFLQLKVFPKVQLRSSFAKGKTWLSFPC